MAIKNYLYGGLEEDASESSYPSSNAIVAKSVTFLVELKADNTKLSQMGMGTYIEYSPAIFSPKCHSVPRKATHSRAQQPSCSNSRVQFQ